MTDIWISPVTVTLQPSSHILSLPLVMKIDGIHTKKRCLAALTSYWQTARQACLKGPWLNLTGRILCWTGPDRFVESYPFAPKQNFLTWHWGLPTVQHLLRTSRIYQMWATSGTPFHSEMILLLLLFLEGLFWWLSFHRFQARPQYARRVHYSFNIYMCFKMSRNLTLCGYCRFSAL